MLLGAPHPPALLGHIVVVVDQHVAAVLSRLPLEPAAPEVSEPAQDRQHRLAPERGIAEVPTPGNINVNLGVFARRFSTVSDRFSGSWCRFPESWGQDGENGEKTGKKRAKMGEKWSKKSGGRWQSLLCGVGRSIDRNADRLLLWTGVAAMPADRQEQRGITTCR